MRLLAVACGELSSMEQFRMSGWAQSRAIALLPAPHAARAVARSARGAMLVGDLIKGTFGSFCNTSRTLFTVCTVRLSN